jgi:hypothetical protein
MDTEYRIAFFGTNKVIAMGSDKEQVMNDVVNLMREYIKQFELKLYWDNPYIDLISKKEVYLGWLKL